MLAFGARMTNVTTSELMERLEKGEKLTVIDVREPWEYAEGHVSGSLLRPLGQIRAWAAEFDKNTEIFLICRTGARSGSAYQFLQTLGFKSLRNVSGGIITWRGAVDR
jgi:rhodanese-related sulfurtransferase